MNVFIFLMLVFSCVSLAAEELEETCPDSEQERIEQVMEMYSIETTEEVYALAATDLTLEAYLDIESPFYESVCTSFLMQMEWAEKRRELEETCPDSEQERIEQVMEMYSIETTEGVSALAAHDEILKQYIDIESPFNEEVCQLFLSRIKLMESCSSLSLNQYLERKLYEVDGMKPCPGL